MAKDASQLQWLVKTNNLIKMADIWVVSKGLGISIHFMVLDSIFYFY